MFRLYWRSLKGTRPTDETPHGPWRTSAFIGGLRGDGVVESAAGDGELFPIWVEQ
jgi:hypothetical protein